MAHRPPPVTVIAACYNHVRFVVECLESIRNQTYRNIQLVIVDDASTDESVGPIEAWVDRYGVDCVLIKHEKNRGVCKTLNEGLALAAGKYVTGIATDDVWMPDKIELQVRRMEELPEDVGVIYSDALLIDEAGHARPGRFIEAHRKFAVMPEGHIFPTLLEGNFIAVTTALIRRSCLDVVGLFDEDLLYEDYDFWLRLSQHYKFVFSDVISAKYRIVSTSMTLGVLDGNSDALLASDFLMWLKCLRFQGLTTGQKALLTPRLSGLAEALYARNSGVSKGFLWRLFKVHRTPRTIGMLISASCAVPHKSFDSLSRRLSLRYRLQSLAGNYDRTP
jgi:glycosyltransferase involved in cell wall biosynthesis